MKEIARHNFIKNGKSIVCYYLNSRAKKKAKVPDCDCICLSFEGIENTNIFLRPDEALIVAKQLIESVYKTTIGYDIRFIAKTKKISCK